MILTHLVFYSFLNGAGTAAIPPDPSVSTYAPNWLSPTIRLALALFAVLTHWRM